MQEPTQARVLTRKLRTGRYSFTLDDIVLGGKDPELPEVLLASLLPDLHLAWLSLPLPI